MCGRVREGTDDLKQLDDRAGPSVRDDQRQRVLVARLDVNEVDVEPVDLGRELRQGVQPCLARAPVVVVTPVRDERRQRRELHALRVISYELRAGPACFSDATMEVVERIVRKLDVEGDDFDAGLDAGAHEATSQLAGHR